MRSEELSGIQREGAKQYVCYEYEALTALMVWSYGSEGDSGLQQVVILEERCVFV